MDAALVGGPGPDSQAERPYTNKNPNKVDASLVMSRPELSPYANKNPNKVDASLVMSRPELS